MLPLLPELSRWHSQSRMDAVVIVVGDLLGECLDELRDGLEPIGVSELNLESIEERFLRTIAPR